LLLLLCLAHLVQQHVLHQRCAPSLLLQLACLLHLLPCAHLPLLLLARAVRFPGLYPLLAHQRQAGPLLLSLLAMMLCLLLSSPLLKVLQQLLLSHHRHLLQALLQQQQQAASAAEPLPAG
jgi:hypothetical protein